MNPGTRLGPYEILEPLGAGGMGEVYRAHDSRLKRDVAVKVLPPELANDADRMARLRREAQLLATVQDRNIASVYGLEQDGSTLFLVMELVEGRGLDEMIAEAPLPPRHALEFAAQIADGLTAAHDQGVIHRDLKPSNVRVTVDDIAKVLDFGLAQADPQGPSGSSPSHLTASPTMASPTMAGVILGTAPYMSPEQARGKPLDRRTDVWSFGCVLYEMLTGARPFTGETVTDVLAAVVKEEPDWSALPAPLDPRATAILQRCLRKDTRQRQRDLGDVALQIRELLAAGPGDADSTSASASGRAGRSAAVAGWAVAAVMTAVAAWAWLDNPAADTSATAPLSWLVIPPPTEMELGRPGERATLSVSPRGTDVVYVARFEGSNWLLQRALDNVEHRRLEGSRGAQQHFFSPDGSSIAVYTGSRIVVIPADGGTPRELCSRCTARFGGTWSEDGSIVVTPNWAGGLYVVPEAGGEPEPLTSLDTARGDITHIYPSALPGGTHVLFSIWAPDIDARMAAVVRLSDRKVTIVARGGNSYRYAAGHLLFERGGVLSAMPFDLETLSVTGDAYALMSDLQRISADGFAAFAVSNNGVLVLRKGHDGTLKEALWVDRQGNVEPALTEPGLFTNPALSPGGQLLAVATPVDNSGYRVFVYDLEGGTRTELTPAGDNLIPVFSPDGQRVLFVSSLFDDYVIAQAAVDGSMPLQVVVDTTQYAGPTDWSPDGRSLVYDKSDPNGNKDIWMLTEGASEPRAVANTGASESGATFSPDGRWLAYTSDVAGRKELYLVRADGQGAARQITRLGIHAARWSPAGGEIFIEKDEGIWSLPVETEPALRVGTPVRLFDLPGKRWSADDSRAEFDVTGDGRRFVVVRAVESSLDERRIYLIQNLPELLRRRGQ